MVELHEKQVCNNTELHTRKSCNCYATADATAMQQERIKARALAVLRRNKECNSDATASKEPCNKPCNNQPEVAQKVASPTDLQHMVSEALAEVDRVGRPWPVRFFANLPEDDRQRLRELEKAIDAAVIGNDAEALPGLLTDWRRLLLSKLN